MPGKTDAATLLAADQNFVLEHQFTNVLEPDRPLIQLQTKLFGNARYQQALRISSRDRSPPTFVSIGVQQKERQRLKRVHILAVLIDDAKTVRIAIRCEPNVTVRFP